MPGIAGIVQVVREAYPDRTAFDPKDDHYDADSDPDKPRWYMVDVKLVERSSTGRSRSRSLRKHASGKLKDMVVLKRGNRLSITPVTKRNGSSSSRSREASA